MWFTEFLGNNIARIEVGGTFISRTVPTLQQPVTSAAPKPKPACRVPRVRGLSVRKARKKMRRAGCRYRVRGKGRVVSSRPKAGARTRNVVQLKAKRKRRAR
jgi:hypothetical protein